MEFSVTEAATMGRPRGEGGIKHIVRFFVAMFTFILIMGVAAPVLAGSGGPSESLSYPTYFEKVCMPDLGQHSNNWCWVAAAANSIYWYSQHGYPELIDDPADPTPNDNKYINQMIPHPPMNLPLPCSVYRLLHEIATDCLYPHVPESVITIDNTYCMPINDIQYFFGLQEFINEQGAPLVVHEIVDNNLVKLAPPEDGIKVIYRPPTLEDYQRELERCQDVLLWLNYRHENHENYEKHEETDHVVTGVGFSYDNTWILVSDPWTPGAPDHSNDLLHENTPYDNLQVMSVPNEPLWVFYAGAPRQVSKMVYISPIDNTPPDKPSLVSPENCNDILDNTPTFVWTSVTDPSGVTYQIQIDNGIDLIPPDFIYPVYDVAGITENTYTLPDENALQICVHYWWRVRVTDGAGNIGPWSEEWHFHVVPVGAIGALMMSLLLLLPFALVLRRQNRRPY